MAQHRRVKRGMTRTFSTRCSRPDGAGVGAAARSASAAAAATSGGLRGACVRRNRRSDGAARAPATGGRGGLADVQSTARAPAVLRALALATKPRVLLLDELAASIPAAVAASCSWCFRRTCRAVAVLFIEHDMGLVFRAERITVWAGVLTEGAPQEIAADPRVKGLPWAKASMAELLRSNGLSAGWWSPRPRQPGAAGRRQPRAARPRRHGQDHAADGDGDSTACSPARSIGAAPTLRASRRFAVRCAGLGWVPQERRTVRVADGAHPNTSGGRAPRRVDAARVRAVAAPWPASRRQLRQPAPGGERRDAGDRPGADDERASCCSTSRWRGWRGSSCRS